VAPASEPTSGPATSFQGSEKQKPAKRATSAAPEMEKKSFGGREHETITSDTLRGAPASAPSTALTQVRIRVSLSTPSAAPASLKGAITRSGGSLIDDGRPQPRTLKARIPSPRLDELLEQLGRLGRVVEKPPAHYAAGIVEIEIIW
jgi:hypothetical protein